MNYDKALVAGKLRRWETYLNNYRLPDWEQIPDLGLYMEQVIVLLRQYLDYLPPELKDEEYITSAAINNYVRTKIMPEPVKKRYYRVHIAYLLVICTLKQGLSIGLIRKLLPTGNVVDKIETSRGVIEASIVDCANPVIFVRAESVGMNGTESQEEIDGNPELLKYLEEIRGIACVKCGMAKDLADATKNSPAFPMVAFITEAQDYYYPAGDKHVKKEEVDLVSRLMFMQVLHKTYAGTATVCTGVAAKIKGTLVNQVLHNDNPPELVRIGHPAGMIPCYSQVDENNVVKKAAIVRTARRLMEGYALLEKSKYNHQ